MTQIGRMFEQEKIDAVRDATISNLFKYVSDGVMNIDYAAGQVNMSVEDFSKAMEEHGYRAPQLA